LGGKNCLATGSAGNTNDGSGYEMKRTIQTIAFVVVACAMAGCATSRPYFADRVRDGVDIPTVTVGAGVGIKARFGPVHSGLGFFRDAGGLRGGEFASTWTGSRDCVLPMPVPCGAALDRYGPLWVFMACYDFEALEISPVAMERGKEFEVYSLVPLWVPVIGLAEDFRQPGERPWYYYTQVEVVAGAGPSVRLGLNPGELLDFVLGWATLGVFDDDVQQR
jgi:hypothetical protein